MKPIEEWELRLQVITGHAVREMRKAHGDKVDKIAALLGDTADSIRKKERGERRFSVAEIAVLACYWNAAADKLVFGEGQRPTFRHHMSLEFPVGNSSLSETPRPGDGRTRN